ncbi:FAD:protein FMN transferase, partial [Salmonella enterica]|uniref:FAD:protein FMN transferase n=1 Tax=Salmonella enterica TaxID=28901 RepID=UPI00398C6C4F
PPAYLTSSCLVLSRVPPVMLPPPRPAIVHILVSVTVSAPTALDADVWDTGLMVLGTQKAQEVVRREGLSVFMIMKEGEGFKTWMSPQFKTFRVSDKN